MEGSASAFPDWAHLPPLVLHLISEKVKSVTDYVRFRAVCSPWRSASLAKPCHLPFQLPWLMIPHHPWGKQDDGIRLFYDLWQEKMHKIHLPEIVGKTCCASYHGWLLLVARGGTELCLLNPLTQAHVELPPFTIPVNDDSDEELTNCLFSEHMITKITFSSDLTDPNCIIVVLCISQGVYFCKVGDFCWTDAVPHPVWKENVPLPVRRSLLQDAAYNNGSVYLLYEVAMVIYDLNTQRLQRYLFKPKLHHVTKFFFVGKSGVYFVAFHSAKGVKEALGQKFELYQVQEQPMVVKRIVDTSDIAIFCGDSYHYLAVCADDWDSFDGDCMYAVLDSFGDRGLLDSGSYSIYCAKLDSGKSKPVVLGLGKGLVDFLWMFPEPKIWFQPSLV